MRDEVKDQISDSIYIIANQIFRIQRISHVILLNFNGILKIKLTNNYNCND